MPGGHKPIPVFAYDHEGKYAAAFPSISACARALKVKSPNVISALNRNGTAAGHYIRKRKVSHIPASQLVRRNTYFPIKPLYRYDKHGNLMNVVKAEQWQRLPAYVRTLIGTRLSRNVIVSVRGRYYSYRDVGNAKLLHEYRPGRKKPGIIAIAPSGKRGIYLSISATERALGISCYHVDSVLQGLRKSVRGFKFKYAKPNVDPRKFTTLSRDELLPVWRPSGKNLRGIIGISPSGEHGLYSSATDAGRAIGIAATHVRAILRGDRQSFRGFKFKYAKANEDPRKFKTLSRDELLPLPGKPFKVLACDQSGAILKEFDTMFRCSRYYGVPFNVIRQAILSAKPLENGILIRAVHVDKL